MSRLVKNLDYTNTEKTLTRTAEELTDGLNLLNSIQQPLVTIFGSHAIKEADPSYQHCKSLSFELGKRGYGVMSGGGPGIMQAANQGAFEAGAISIGLQAHLLKNELITDAIFTHKLQFDFIFVRRFIMSIKSEALIFYPGGYGTLNELFEYAVLMQTGIVDTVPIICVNRAFWQGLFTWVQKENAGQRYLTDQDLSLIRFADDQEDIFRICNV